MEEASEVSSENEVAGGSTGTTASGIKFWGAVQAQLKLRKEMRVFEDTEDVTPKPVAETGALDEFVQLRVNIEDFLKNLPERKPAEEIIPKRTSLGAALRVTIDDVVNGLSKGLLILYEQQAAQAKRREALQCLKEKEPKITAFIKVYLQQTEDVVLYEQRSTTVPAGTDDAKRVEKENRAYEYVTKGRGRLRRKADAETQTTLILFKSRDANTDVIKTFAVASYVSNYDMFDTYQQLERATSKVKMNESKSMKVITYGDDGDLCAKIGRTKAFELCQMITQRVLAGNVFNHQQRRFRNMYQPDPYSPEVDYLYKVRVLWDLASQSEEKERHAVGCMSWCPSNGDILAVGYGIFTCAPNFSPKSGYVCIWSIKNPMSPEKFFEYQTSVVSVEFSPYRPQLLAIGLFDGTVVVRDITTEDDSIVAISQRQTSPGYEPVTDIKWIGLDPGEEADIEPFLTVSQDASVMKYRIINSPYLLGYQHAVLDRVEGSPEGLPVQRNWNTLEAVRHPQCLGITLDPTKQDIFYVFSNEGVLYRCSTNYPQQHLDLWQTHDGATYSMEFSPWSPKLFLTCGDDWCIRVWIEGIFKPLITLSNKTSPINCAVWSKTHSTVIISITRKTIDVWDLRRSTLKPMSSTKFRKSHLTLCKLSNCGRSVAVGNERGEVHMCALDDMPFSPHFQYEELEAAIFKALMPFPDLATELKGIGYFGYPRPYRSII